ncbi:hypothetical protein L0222_17705, partial [bacterium]|nr:hypothetical protein [bacterium]
NQMETSDHPERMNWLPMPLPNQVRMIISTLPGRFQDALLRLQDKVESIELKGLTPSEIEIFVKEYLDEIRHEFPNIEVEREFLSKVKQGNPLYLTVALEELRLFGKFDELGSRIRRLPVTVPELFDQVLERLESDFGVLLVRDCMRFLYCGRHGLSGEELQDLLKEHAPNLNAQDQPEKLPDMIWARLYRACQAYLFQRSGIIDFFDHQMKVAVGSRYFPDQQTRSRTHKTIADYLKRRWREPYARALDELPHQRIAAGDLPGAEEILSNLEFLESKCVAGMTYNLISDYDELGVRSNQPGPPIVTALFDGVRYSVHCPFCLSRVEMEQTTLGKRGRCPECNNALYLNAFFIERAWNKLQPQRKRPTDPLDAPTNGSESMQQFADFIRQQAHILSATPHLFFQQAANYPVNTAPAAAAAQRLKSGVESRIWIRRINKTSQQTPTNRLTFEGHRADITDFVITPDGTRLISSSWDRTIRIWDLQDGNELLTISGHNDAVKKVALTSDGERIISSSDDGTLRIWDAMTGAALAVLESHQGPINSFALSQDGKFILSAAKDRTVIVWDAMNFLSYQTLNGHQGSVYACTFLADDHLAASASDDGTIRLWDLYSAREITKLQGQSYVAHLTLSPDGRYLLSASGDKTLKLWDAASGDELFTLRGHKAEISCCNFSPDGKTVFSAGFDETIRIWDVQDGKEIAMLPGLKATAYSASFAPDGTCIAAASGEQIKLWDLRTNHEMATFSGHRNSVQRCGFTPDGKSIVSASADSTLKLWDATQSSGETEDAPNDEIILACKFSPDRRMIATTSLNGITKVVRASDAQKLHTLAGAQSCRFLPDSRRLLFLGKDSQWRIVDLQNGAEIVRFKSGMEKATFMGMPSRVRVAHLSRNGRYFLCSHDRGFQLWKLEKTPRLFDLKGHSNRVFDCEFSPDCNRFVSASLDKNVKIWETTKGTEVFTLRGHRESVWVSTYSPDGKKILSASEDKTLKLWDAETGKELHTLTGHNDWVTECEFDPAGKRILSCSRDANIRLWDADGGQLLFSIFAGNEAATLASFSSDGRRILSSSRHGSVLNIWSVDSGKEIARYAAPDRLGSFAHAELSIAACCGSELHLLQLENIAIDPIIVTPRLWQKKGLFSRMTSRKIAYEFVCPVCSKCHMIEESSFGKEILCMACGRAIKLNPFAV